MLECADEESPGGRQVPLLGGQHVDDLPELINRPVQIQPPRPATFTNTNVSPQTSDHLTQTRHGRAASINNDVKRCTYRKP
jgi:hypothetical protein